MIASFREELNISRARDLLGNPTYLPVYMFCHSKTDLATGTVTIIDWDDSASIGKVCNLIASFEVSERDTNEGIITFLKNDKYFRTEEY